MTRHTPYFFPSHSISFCLWLNGRFPHRNHPVVIDLSPTTISEA
ncbi:hypothetical protein [Limnofasciculus baicalensis]|nr:hypothetical protein [Limnofasciculus baicalensis]